MAILSREQLDEIGFVSVGSNVRLSDKASIYGASRIRIGNNVRIDDFCVLSAGEDGIDIGDNVHIAVYTSIIGKGRITISAFANLSSRVSIYSSSDDYSGARMTNPTIPAEFTGVLHAPVTIGRHAIIGCGVVVLPGTAVGDGVAIGALSLIDSDCEEFSIYAGVPARRIGTRKRDLLALEREFVAAQRSGDSHG